MRITIILAALFLVSCRAGDEVNLNAITNQEELTLEACAEKYKLVKPIKEDQIIGKWKMISSFMTVKLSDGRFGNTVLIDEEWEYDIRANGTYTIDDSDEKKWELTENNTTFFDWRDATDPSPESDSYDQWKIRIGNDTMEWILKWDTEYAYQVLVRQ